MKVLLISSDQSILDPGSNGHERARENAIAIGELHVLLPGKKAFERDEGSLRIHVVGEGPFGVSSLFKCARVMVRTHGIEAVWSQDAFERGMLAARVAKAESLPLYVTVDTDFLSPWYSMTGIFRSSKVAVPKVNRMRQRLARKVLPQATGIRVMSERVKTSLIESFRTSIVVPTVIPIPVHKQLPEPVSFPQKRFPFTLMAAGRLDAARRVVDVIDAIMSIRDKYPGVGLFVVGDGPERARLERHVRKCKLEGRVVFLGDRADTWGLMRSAHVFVQASAYEGYGRRILQAALAHIPIITTDVGIVGEVFRGYDDVLSFPPGDPASLAVHIVGLIEDGQARHLLSINAEACAKRYVEEAGDIPARVRAFLSSGRAASAV